MTHGVIVGKPPGRDLRKGTFTVGNSEREAKRRRIAERLEALLADYDPTPSQKQLLAIIAGHLDDAERANTAERRVRAGNAANRLLRLIPKREEERLVSARELLDRWRP